MFLVQEKMLIFFIYQQFLCHATWATRTTLAATPSSTTTTFMPQNEATTKIVITTTQSGIPTVSPPFQATTPLIVTSSEATLLTGNLLTMKSPQRMQRRNFFGRKSKAEKQAKNIANNVPSATQIDGTTLSSSATETNDENKSRYKIVKLHTNCSRDLFEINVDLNRGFRGLLYAKDFPLECRARGSAHTNITLRLPTSGCGVRAEPRADGNMELSVHVMLQMEQKLRQSSDILRIVRCQLPLNAIGMTVTSKENNKQRQNNYRNGRTRNFEDTKRQHKYQKKSQKQETSNYEKQQTDTQPPTTPRVRIWLELGDKDGSGAVEVGQETTLRIRAIVPGSMGVHIVDCAALDGLGESTQQLLDERGCPLDEQVMPALHTSLKPAEEGWSKQNKDDLVEKIFTATFPAFKFPDRERLHVSCGVQLCKGSCPEINCQSTEKLILSLDKHLARIEVFNSLAVTAPQIEVDRLRYDRRYNMSVDEYPPYVRQLPTEGTLCMSVSKLAISFCILGIIFLAAVIVAISSLIRSQQRDMSSLTSNASRIHRGEVCTSMFSSSSGDSSQSARFGSKLFMPYYPTATLPYGRVY